MSKLKQDDLVTVNLGEQNCASNTYRIARKLDSEAVLSHPLFPECYIIRPDTELNTVLAQLKTPMERCLEFLRKYRNYVDFNDKSEIEALCLYFVVTRKLSAAQKAAVAVYCGKIATIHCDNDISIAIKLVNENRALLDEFNRHWYEKFCKFFDQKTTLMSPKQRNSIFNISGFVLAQIEGL